MALDLFGILSRSGAIVMALVLIAASAATVKIINDNEILDKLRDDDYNLGLSQDERELQVVVRLTESGAWWSIILAIATVFAEAIAIIVTVVVGKQQTLKMILGVLEIIGACLAMLVFLATGIACAAYASSWGKPPDACEMLDGLSNSDQEDLCDTVPLTTTTSLQSAVSFVEIGVFGAIILATIFNMQSRPTTDHSWPQKI